MYECKSVNKTVLTCISVSVRFVVKIKYIVILTSYYALKVNTYTPVTH